MRKLYSTTRRVIKANSQEIAQLLKQSNKLEDKFETVLFLPDGEGRQGEGGLRTQGYFKVGGIIPNHACESEENNSKLNIENSTLEAKPLITVVTVVTVVFNGEQFLEETILSVINQTYDNVEYIIIDGGSTDGTVDIIRKYEHAIDYWVSENDKGIYAAMNKGILLASGIWVNFMNAGDVFDDAYVLSAIFNAGSYKNISIIYGSTTIVAKDLAYTVRPKNINLLKSGRMPFVHQSAFIFLDLMKKHLYSLKYKVNSDFNFFLSSYMLRCDFCMVDLVVSKYRTGGYSHQNMKSSYHEKLKILEENNLSRWRFRVYYFYTLLRSKIKLIICPIFKLLGLDKIRILFFVSKRCVS